VRERFPEYPDNLFPDDVKASQSRALRRGDLGLRINADKTTVHAEQRCKLETKPRGSHEHDISCVLGISIEQMLSGSEWRPSIGDLALQSLNSEQHWQHASKRVRDRRKPNIETPHDRFLRKKRLFCDAMFSILKMIILPRQALDNHWKSWRKEWCVFLIEFTEGWAV
jgi:hypothetical protein